jgi:hypothetical protein
MWRHGAQRIGVRRQPIAQRRRLVVDDLVDPRRAARDGEDRRGRRVVNVDTDVRRSPQPTTQPWVDASAPFGESVRVVTGDERKVVDAKAVDRLAFGCKEKGID